MSDTDKIAELELILSNYTTIFIIFDIIFFVMILLGIILLIRFLKSKKNLHDSNEYLLYTITGQEEERARIARELHDTVAQDLRYCKNLLEKERSRIHFSGCCTTRKNAVTGTDDKLQSFAG